MKTVLIKLSPSLEKEVNEKEMNGWKIIKFSSVLLDFDEISAFLQENHFGSRLLFLVSVPIQREVALQAAYEDESSNKMFATSEPFLIFSREEEGWNTLKEHFLPKLLEVHDEA